jgi:hypothetical protein
MTRPPAAHAAGAGGRQAESLQACLPHPHHSVAGGRVLGALSACHRAALPARPASVPTPPAAAERAAGPTGGPTYLSWVSLDPGGAAGCTWPQPGRGQASRRPQRRPAACCSCLASSARPDPASSAWQASSGSAAPQRKAGQGMGWAPACSCELTCCAMQSLQKLWPAQLPAGGDGGRGSM